MHHQPMTYIFRAYCMANEPASYVVYVCNKDGDRKVFPYASATQAKALMEALNGLGFTKKRR